MAVGVVVPRPAIDRTNGNINLHGRCGRTFVFRMQDAAGAFLDIAGRALFLEIDGFERVALGAGGDSTQRTIEISAAVAAALPPRVPTGFLIRDESGGDPRERWSGVINLYGFSAPPP